MTNLGIGQKLQLGADKCGIGISWDKSGVNVDLDLQAVIVNSQGAIVEAVYYNNLKALSAVTHSGDETTGEKCGLDEVIWVTFPKLPPDVKIIIFVVAAYNNGHLKDVSNGMFHVLESRMSNEVAKFRLENSEEEVDAVALFLKGDDGLWSLNVINEPAQDGQHFIDILEPTLGDIIRSIIPTAPKRQKVAFAMDKGSVVDLPKSAAAQKISACLGWDVARNLGKNVDLDVSVIFLDGRGKDLGAVFFGNTEGFGVIHSGDNLTGAGSGDDEVIEVGLEAIPAEVEQMFFVVNIYTKDVSFEQVQNAYCRICDASGSEIAKYVLHDARGEAGLIIARLFREPGNARWGFQALGSFCRGRNWKESLKDVLPIFSKSPRDLQLRGQTTMAVGGGNPGPDTTGGGGAALSSAPPPAQPPAPTAEPPAAEPKGCCIIA